MSDVESTQSVPNPGDPRVVARLHVPRAGAERPDHIGPFRILETLGEGGMGIVYLAEQAKPIHRRVALKIIKLGMDTKQVIARFGTEREALALMNHPNVAKVFDAGVSDQGRPYFVMEYVPGIPITEYCDKHRLNTEERLRLFMDVCNAIQHAHQKGIIHRDIKPSNVLVSVDPSSPTELGGSSLRGAVAPSLRGFPKVIDFGVAKAIQHRLTERTLFTEQGQLIGTPGYMSPEQAELTALDIDTRTDVYSLGVLLYELLVGAMPFDTRTLLQLGFAEIQRVIREVDPPNPSTKLRSLGNDSSVVAQKRRTNPRTLLRQMRGDLDWIIMKCLEKDRSLRYETAISLAREISNYLQDRPLIARRPSALYRLNKLRRRRPVVFCMLILMLITPFAMIAFAVYIFAQPYRIARLNHWMSLEGVTLDAYASDLEPGTRVVLLAANYPKELYELARSEAWALRGSSDVARTRDAQRLVAYASYRRGDFERALAELYEVYSGRGAWTIAAPGSLIFDREVTDSSDLAFLTMIYVKLRRLPDAETCLSLIKQRQISHDELSNELQLIEEAQGLFNSASMPFQN